MPSNAEKNKEAAQASWEATRGALYGASKFGLGMAVLAGIGYAVSPIYRGLTIQFKVYIQMSGMVLGGMLEADHRVREYEAKMRLQRRVMRDRAMWQRFEDEYGKDDDDVK